MLSVPTEKRLQTIQSAYPAESNHRAPHTTGLVSAKAQHHLYALATPLRTSLPGLPLHRYSMLAPHSTPYPTPHHRLQIGNTKDWARSGLLPSLLLNGTVQFCSLHLTYMRWSRRDRPSRQLSSPMKMVEIRIFQSMINTTMATGTILATLLQEASNRACAR